MTCGVYAIKNTLTGELYVGSSDDIERRFTSHVSALATGGRTVKKLKAAWAQYGSDAFSLVVLETTDPAGRVEAEQQWVAKLRPAYNTRVQDVCSNRGIKWTVEENAKKCARFRVHEVDSVVGTVGELAKHFGVVSVEVAKSRRTRGWDVRRAVLEPPADYAERGRRAAKTHKANGTHPSHKLLEYKGEVLPLKTLVERYSSLPYATVQMRVLRGWPVDKALEVPLTPTTERRGTDKLRRMSE